MCKKSSLAGIFAVAVLGGVLAAMAPAARASAGEVAPAAIARLFTIHRSTNANFVAYDARMGPDGFETEEPIRASWIMLASDGHVEALTSIEERAYGVKVESASSAEVRFTLAALPSRPITLRRGADEPEAILSIQGVPCRLFTIFLSVGGVIVPTVRYADITGYSLADGSVVTERITR